MVTVYPKATKGQAAAPLGRFIAKPGGFRFGDLRNTLSFQGWASFKAGALYNVKAGGRGAYTFAVALSSEERKSYFYRISCEVGLHVADQDPIVPANNKLVVQTQGNFQRTFVGSANLEEGAHPIDLSVACSFTNGTQGQTADDFFDGPLGVRNVFDAIQVSVTVFGPNDMQARIPQVAELIHNVIGASR
ncbi:hypothetical protein [Methylobacterium radiotolerans]|uniref:hypothetical protein n=1 Tax=Methylobacterium radiotolerans TaxID=31998 RepID=UPI000975FCEA|nr:hypothetical protein [Methylobacterium radiotolerans]ONF47356.1 hypothetical protein RSM1_19910 [Methylobacterium radiotolerans]